MADWPVSYDDLEPYYENVEYLVGVSGAGGSNPFAAPRSKDYPLPPLRRSGLTDLAEDAMAKSGFNPFPQPAAVISQNYKGREACTYCGYCTGHGCWNDAKSSTLVSAIREAEKTDKLEIRTNSRVTKILSNDKGQTTGVQYLDENGIEQEQPAGVVILATYVYENSRLLLVSRSDHFQNGLGNNAGNVGKYYMAHSYGGPSGIIPGKNFNLLSGTVSQGTAMDDLNGDNFDHTGLGFIRGAVSFAGPSESTPIAQSRKVPPGTPGWGAAYKKFIHDGAQSVTGVFTQLEVLPYEGNFLDLDPSQKDDIGMPVIRVTFSLGENERKANAHINEQLARVVKEMGATQTWAAPEPATIPINSHAYGGTRMGDDPATSVVNKYGLSHEAPNLMVLGGSNWCNTTGYNPTETIEAHAWYAAEYLANNLSSIAV